MTKTLRFLAAVLLALATAASAQVGSPPGVGYPPFTSGGAFTGSLKGPTGCTLPGFSFTGDTNAGLCLVAANSVRLQNNTSSSVSTSYVSLGTTTGSLVFNDAAGFDGQFRLLDDTADIAAAGATQLTIAGATSMFTFGNTTTRDELILQPVVAGAGSFAGTFTTDDLTAGRTWTFPNFTGSVLLSGTLDVVVPDDAAGTPAVATLSAPTALSYRYECQDANGCEITLSGGGVTAVRRVTITRHDNSVGYLEVQPGGAGTTRLTTANQFLQCDTSGLGDWYCGHRAEVLSTQLVFEGASTDAFKTTLAIADPTAGRTITFANDDGTVMLSSLATNAAGVANSVTGGTNQLIFEGATGNGFQTVLQPVDPTADQTIRVPNSSGDIVVASVFNFQIPNNAAGASPATYTLDPANGINTVTLDCADPDGCEVTMGETNPVGGQPLTIIELAATAGNITLIHNGTTATLDAGANVVFTGVGDAVQLRYVPSVWLQIAPLYDAS